MHEDWERWGRKDPYYAVIADERFRTGQLTQARRTEFFASGSQHIERILTNAEQALGPVPRGKALDYGCGVGRLLPSLSERFRQVYGGDIAAEMLAEARRNCYGLPNVSCVALPEGFAELAEFDFIHSVIVFQHIRPRLGMEILTRLVGLLSASGVAAIELLYLRHATPLRRTNHFLRTRIHYYHVACNLLQRRSLTDPPMLMNPYNLSVLFERLRRAGITRLAADLYQDGEFEKTFLYFRRT